MKRIENNHSSISWKKNKKTIEAEKNIDGLYPLLSTDPNLSAKEVLMAYKYQPKLEKRFTQLKSIQMLHRYYSRSLREWRLICFYFYCINDSSL